MTPQQGPHESLVADSHTGTSRFEEPVSLGAAVQSAFGVKRQNEILLKPWRRREGHPFALAPDWRPTLRAPGKPGIRSVQPRGHAGH
jgi:hypothetical protein